MPEKDSTLPRRVAGGYVKPCEETVFPDPGRVGHLNHALRYSAEPLTVKERLFLASVCSAYIHLLTYPLGVEHTIRTLRKWRRALRLLEVTHG